MTVPEISPRDLRVSDAERAHTLSLLERATGRGLITVGEFSERSGRVIRAKTRADLNLLLLDLPGLQLSGRPYDPALPDEWSAAPPPVGEVLQLKGYGSRQFTGHWTAPALIVVSGTGAGTTLDFTQARWTTPVVTIRFESNLGGTTHLRVPSGTQIRCDRLDLRGCSLHNSVPPVNGPAPLVLDLVGLKRYGAIHIRQPRTNGLRRFLEGLAPRPVAVDNRWQR